MKRMANKLVSSLILVNFFFISSICSAETIWEKRKKALEEGVGAQTETSLSSMQLSAEQGAQKTSLDPKNITIPPQYGSIIETHEGTNGNLIVHIQSAHTNYEGQKNIAHILESLINEYDLDLVLMEGKFENADFKYLRKRASLDVRKEKADGLLKDGYITGVNYLDIASDYPMIIRGIEQKNLYDKNRETLWEIDKFKDLASEYVGKLIIAVDVLKSHIYNEKLQELDSKKRDYENGTIDLLTYYEYLYRLAQENDLPLYTFPNLSNLIKASDIEKQIDLAKIRDGSAEASDFELYNDYQKITRDLNINELFKEEPILEDFLKDILSENSTQRKLIRVSKALSIMGNLLRIKVVPEEYKYFVDNKKDFDPKFWTDFIDAESGELNLDIDTPNNFYIISDNLKTIEKFYGIAFERDETFVKRTKEHLQRERINLAALVAGGFHTPTLTKLLAESGYSYVVVSPKVTTETDDSRYRWALKMEWLPEIQ